MNAREFSTLVSDSSDWSMAHLDRVTATLRAHGLLDTGGRGPHAPHITRHQAARILIALGSEANPALAAEAVKTYAALKPTSKSSLWGRNFGEGLSHLLGDPFMSLNVHSIAFHQAVPSRAVITWKRPIESGNKMEAINESVYLPPGRDGSEDPRSAYKSVTFTGPLIHEICVAVRDPHDRYVEQKNPFEAYDKLIGRPDNGK